jgi:WD40 repeat protein
VLFDAAGRERLSERPLAVPEGEVNSVAFSPDGKTLAAGYSRGLFVGVVGGVAVFDVAGRKRLSEQPLDVAKGAVNSVAFSPDGKILAASYRVDDVINGVTLFDIDPDSWQRIAGQIANRNFTREEWRQYMPETEKYRATFPNLPLEEEPETTPPR